MDNYKIYLNLLPYCRGGVKTAIYRLFRRGVRLGRNTRIKRNTEWRLFPGCTFLSGRGLIVGKDVTLSVSNKAQLIIGENVGIGNRSQIVCHKSIKIGNGTIIAPGVMIYDHNHLYDKNTGVKQREFDDGEVVIGSHCWLGAGCIVLKDVHIGDSCIVGAGSVVTKDIPAGTVVAGVPARVIKQ